MSIPDPLRQTLEAAGYRIAETDRAALPHHTPLPNHTALPHQWRVVDAAGTQGLCAAVDAAGELDEDAVADVADELSSGRHRHLVGLHDALIIPDADTTGVGIQADLARRTPGEGTHPGATSLALIWAIDSRSETLGEYRARTDLTLAQVSAVLVAASRALASLESLRLPPEPQWDLDDLMLQDDGMLQRVAPTIVRQEAQTHTQLRQIARRGQELLAGVAAEQCTDLAHLLTATAFDQDPVSAGTFAALCYELVSPAAADSWEPLPSDHAADDTPSAGSPAEFDGRESDSEPIDDAVAARYTQLSDTWRDHLRGSQPAASTLLPGLRLPRWRTRGARSPKARHLQPRLRGKAWRRPSVIGGTFCVGLVAVLLGNQLFSGGNQPAEDAQAAEHQGIGAHNGEISRKAAGLTAPQEEEKIQEAGKTPERPDPAAAAMELTEERIRILQELNTASNSESTVEGQERLASVLVPLSPAMAADLDLITQLERSEVSTEPVFAQARASKMLEEDNESAVVEVSYDLVDPSAGRVAQTATLTLAMTDGTWRVDKVSGVPPIEPHL